jgi:hypothetical protein
MTLKPLLQSAFVSAGLAKGNFPKINFARITPKDQTSILLLYCYFLPIISGAI